MKRPLLILFILSSLLLTACWDMAEINQRLFVSSIGVDLNPDWDGESLDKYLVTYAYPNINAIGKNASEEEKKFTFSIPSSSIFKAGKKFSTFEEFPFRYKHLQVFVIGEELAQDGKLVRQAIDELNRDTKINKRTQILVTAGTAREVLESKASHLHTSNSTIYNILTDNKSAAKFTPQTLTFFIRELDCNNVSFLPKIDKVGEKLVIAGAGIIKDYELIGYLNEDENRAMAFLKNEVKQELIDVEYEKGLISYNIIRAKASKSVDIGQDIEVNIGLRVLGYLQGYTVDKSVNVFENTVLKGMEKALEEQIQKEINHFIAKTQEKFNADLLGIAEYLSKFYPKEWEKIKDNWDKIYTDIKFNTSVNVIIKRTGLTK